MNRPAVADDPPLQAALRRCRRHFAFAGGFSALINLLYLAPTIFMLQVYDRVLPARGGVTLAYLIVVLALAIATLALLDSVRGRLMTRASLHLDRQLSREILDASLAQDEAPRGAAGRQVLRDFDVLRQTLTGAPVLALFDAPWTPIFMLVCALIHPLLGVIALLGSVLIVALAYLTDRATRDRLKRAGEAAGVAYVNQDHAAANSDIVRALGMRGAMVRRQLADRESSHRLQTEASFAASGLMAATRFVRIFLQSLALAAGAFLAIHQQISPGAVFAASLLTARAMSPIEQVVASWRSLLQGRVAYRSIDQLLQRRSTAAPTALPRPTGVLKIESVSILNAAKDAAILNDVTFAVDAGEVVGIVGPSGAGKSTLLRAICGAAGLDRGAVRLDGADRGDWDGDEIGALMGFMPQEAVLFAGSVKDNISRFAGVESDADRRRIDEQTVAAAQAAEAHELILGLPGGYDTMIGWRGEGLSAGQSQRICLARALYGDPAVVLLDEPNAHVDAEGEAALVRTLERLKARGVTVLVAAHRTGVISAIDRLMVIRDGRIVMFGRKEEVLGRMGRPGAAPVSNVTNLGGRA